MCSAVIPILELGCLRLIPVLANRSNTSACPHLAARWTGVKPGLFSSFGDTPFTSLGTMITSYEENTHSSILHDFDSLQMASLRGQVQRRVLIEPVLGLGHEGGVDIEHGLEQGT